MSRCGRVEVNRLVAEGAPPVDVEHLQFVGELADQPVEDVGGHEVLAVHPGLQLGQRHQLVQPDRVDHRGGRGHGLLGGRARPRPGCGGARRVQVDEVIADHVCSSTPTDELRCAAAAAGPGWFGTA